MHLGGTRGGELGSVFDSPSVLLLVELLHIDIANTHHPT